MQESPDQEWRRLSEHYAGMYDEELLELARDYKDLTELAQQALRDEMRKRGLGEPLAPIPVSQRAGGSASQPASKPAAPRERAVPPAAPAPLDPRAEQDRLRFAAHYATLGDDDLLDLADEMESLTAGAQTALGQELEKRDLGEMRVITETQEEEESDALARAEQRIASGGDESADSVDAGHQDEYSWKVTIPTFNTPEEAWQRAEMLRRAGLDCWYSDRTYCTIQVAADQVDEAKRVLAQPVPADIVEDSQTKVQEYEMPGCPKCHAADPVLIDTEPSNKWLCESCGNEWSDPVAADAAG